MLAVECCKSNTARKRWEALITRIPDASLTAVSSPWYLLQLHMCS